MGRISTHLVVQDAVIPRTRLPEVLARSQPSARKQRIRICNVFHAGDGNLHPKIAYDAADADETSRVHDAMGEIMAACVAAGGTITGEHGVGLDKMAYMELIFSPDSARDDVRAARRVRSRAASESGEGRADACVPRMDGRSIAAQA